jgi:release factor glutamine methyltransferase
MSLQETRFRLPDIEPMRGVYRPSADSELLARAFTRFQPSSRLDVLDLCCGSGIQGINAAMQGHRVDAVDSERCAVINARRNASMNVVQMRVLRGDLFRPVRGRQYDAILVNPPYLPTPDNVRNHSWSDGGRNGRALIDRICREVPEYLNDWGSLWMVHSSIANIDKTHQLLRESGFHVAEVAERFEPFGPVTMERRAFLVELGLIGPDEDTERLVVIQAALDADQVAEPLTDS